MSGTSLSKEQMRAARLRALGQSDTSLTTQDLDNWNIKTDDLPAEKKQALEINRFLDEKEFQQIENIMFGGRKRLSEGGIVSDQDMQRWFEQGFQFSNDPSSIFGLRQGNGGPCGILAVVQAEILYEMLFSDKIKSLLPSGDLLPSQISPSDLEYLLTNALSVILSRASFAEGNNDKVIYLLSPTNDSASLRFFSLNAKLLQVETFSSMEEARQGVYDRLPQFQSSHGCVLFLMSLILSR